MTMALFKYDELGRPLTKEEVDENWALIEAAVNGSGAEALPVSAIALVDDVTGQYLRFLDSEGERGCQYPLPRNAGSGGRLGEPDRLHHTSHRQPIWAVHISAVWHTLLTYSPTILRLGNGLNLVRPVRHPLHLNLALLGLDAMTMQDAIEELAESLGGETTADAVTFDPAASGLAATDVEAALTELATRSTAAESVSVEPVGSMTATDVQSALERSHWST